MLPSAFNANRKKQSTSAAFISVNFIIVAVKNGTIDFLEIVANGDDIINEETILILKPTS